MDFRSDNVCGAHPAIVEALTVASHGSTSSYGADPWTERLQARFSALFEREVAVFPVLTGTAANALALALCTTPWGAVYCHHEAHVHVDECGAPEQMTGGAKLVPLTGDHGKLTPDIVRAAIHGVGVVHEVQPAALSLSQSTEAGTVYTVHELQALGEVAKRHRLAVHMDGARFANAVVALGVSPAALTWQAGIDVLCFGATKNGCLAAEAIVLFDPSRAAELAFRRKRAGHLLSKQRFISAQLEAYLAGDLWLRNARHANERAQELAQLFRAADVPLLAPVQANELFVTLDEARAASLRAAGFAFLDWPAFGARARRFVTSFETRPQDLHALANALATHGRDEIDAAHLSTSRTQCCDTLRAGSRSTS
ncbi:MAG TPA: low specificity L-threonine aldolase [Polyangiales bacterium]